MAEEAEDDYVEVNVHVIDRCFVCQEQVAPDGHNVQGIKQPAAKCGCGCDVVVVLMHGGHVN